MAIDRDFVGREYPGSAPYEVGREHVRRFAEAIGDLHPAYLDPEAARALGHRDVVAPPTFLTVLSFRYSGEGPLADPALGLEVHAGHGLTFDTVGPIAALPEVRELNIGHFLISEALFVGLGPAIKEMRARMDAARQG